MWPARLSQLHSPNISHTSHISQHIHWSFHVGVVCPQQRTSAMGSHNSYMYLDFLNAKGMAPKPSPLAHQHLLVTASFSCCPCARGSSTRWTMGHRHDLPLCEGLYRPFLWKIWVECSVGMWRPGLPLPLPFVPQGFACSLLSFFTGTRSWSVFCNHVLLLPVCTRCHFVKRAPVTLCNAILLYMKMNTAISKSQKRNSSIKLK